MDKEQEMTALNAKEDEKNFKRFLAILRGAGKGFISSINPFFAVMAGAWDGHQASRLKDTLKQLTEKVESLGEEKIDYEYIVNEEFLDLFHQALRARMASRSKAKAKFIHGLLVESLRKERSYQFSADLKEVFISILNGLSEDEMICLSDFVHGKYEGKNRTHFYEKEEITLIISVDGLIEKGILREDDTWEKKLVPSKKGEKFIEYIKLLDKEGF